MNLLKFFKLKKKVTTVINFKFKFIFNVYDTFMNKINRKEAKTHQVIKNY